jgi:hypothetical protein
MVGAAGQERGWDGVRAARAGAPGNEEVETGRWATKRLRRGAGG